MKEAENIPWWREVTGYQWLVLWVAWLGWVFDVMDTALFNFAKASMLTEMLGGAEAYRLHGPQAEGLIATVFLVGWSAGGLIFGVMADRWGRTRTMMLTILLYCLFTGLTALCHTPAQVAAMRFLTALGIGGEWAAGAALVAEVFPARARAHAAGFLQSAAAVGPWLGALVNLQLAAFDWRWLFVVGILPAFVTILIRLRVKEPETWVLHHDHQTAASRGGPLGELFITPRWRRRALVACLLGIVGIAGAWNTSFWLPNLVKSVSSGVAEEVVRTRVSYATMTLHVGTLLGVLVFPMLCVRFGRRPAFAIFFIGSPLAVALAAFGASSFEALLLCGPVMAFFTIGLSAGYALYFPELFPTRLRATGAGFCYNTGRIFSAPFPALAGALIGAFGGHVGAGVAASALIYVPGLIALAWAPETRGQQLPED